jgi:hypothetical protein
LARFEAPVTASRQQQHSAEQDLKSARSTRSTTEETQTPRARCLQKVDMTTIQSGIQRVRAEYLEMPGLRLKAEQVQRLCGIERTSCQTVLDTLVSSRFLYVKADGHYARLTEELFSRPRAANADLRIDTDPKKAS